MAAAVLLATTAGAVTIDTVPVGNAGNDADTRYDTPGYDTPGYGTPGHGTPGYGGVARII